MKRDLKNTPLDAAVVSAIGGVVILFVGLMGLRIVLFSGGSSFSDFVEVIAGSIWGVMIILFSSLLVIDQGRHKLYGVLIMILSIVSWYGTSGGLFFGSAIVFIGGIMGYVWKPKETSSQSQSTLSQNS